MERFTMRESGKHLDPYRKVHPSMGAVGLQRSLAYSSSIWKDLIMGSYRLRIYEIEQENPIDLAVLSEHAKEAIGELIDRSIVPIGSVLISARQEGSRLCLKVMHDSFGIVPEGARIPTEVVKIR